MPLQVVVFSLVGCVGADRLLLKIFHARRKKPMQAKLASFLFRERGSFVQPLVVEEIHPARGVRHN
jgi:hypothetical protein